MRITIEPPDSEFHFESADINHPWNTINYYRLAVKINGHNYVWAETGMYEWPCKMGMFSLVNGRLPADVVAAIKVYTDNEIDMPVWEYLHAVFNRNHNNG